MKKVKIGIVGTGFTIGIAKQHVDAYLENKRAELMGIYDIVPGRAQQWADEKGLEGVVICNSYEELLDKVDAVSICTPNYTHEELSIQALEAGKHVLCEKPISIHHEAAKAMVECAKRHTELVDMTGFCYRGIPAIKYIKEIIEEGKLGKVFGCAHQLGGGRIANPNDVKLEWRMQEQLSGSGALADFGSHMLDLTEFVLGKSEGKIQEVTALITTSITERNRIDEAGKGNVTNDDTAAFAVKMEKGAVSTFFSSRLGVSAHTWEITGEGGTLIYFGEDNQVKILLKDKEGSYKFGEKPQVVEVPMALRNGGRFHDEINEFIENILEGKQSKRNFERGYYIQNILDTLYDSARDHETKVI